MNPTLKIFLIICSLFFIIIIVNESVRGNQKERAYVIKGISAINTSKAQLQKCTWQCHNNTGYCKSNHVRFLNQYFSFVDPVYFGMIHLLTSTGNYQLANIIFLVILWPLLMFILLLKNLKLRHAIKRSKPI